MDLEMTGLDPGKDVIVEIATLVTDDDLEIVAEGPDLVIHQSDEVAGAHGARSSGRCTPVRGCSPPSAASTVNLEDAGAATLAFIKEHVPEPRTVPLCGNSIGTDRRFLAAYLPDIENWLHYRSVDVSSVKELVKRWYPGLSSAHPNKVGSHRALDDIRESVNELRFYRERVFVPVALVQEPHEGSPNGAVERWSRGAAARSGARGHQRGVAGGAGRPKVDAVGVEPVRVRGRVAPPVEHRRAMATRTRRDRLVRRRLPRAGHLHVHEHDAHAAELSHHRVARGGAPWPVRAEVDEHGGPERPLAAEAGDERPG